MIPRLKPWLGAEEIAAVLRPAPADAVPRFEAEFASTFGVRHGIAFPYGRSGLWALFGALGLRGAEVILPAYTCSVVGHATVKSGNEPRFVDCAPGDFNMDLERLAEAITPRTRAVVATHLFGYPLDVGRLTEVVSDAERRHGHRIVIVQDCAHAFGARDRGALVAAQRDVALFGLNISKMMTAIFGGMMTTDDAQLADSLRGYRDANFGPPTAAKAARRRAYLLATIAAFHETVYGAVNWLERETPLLDGLTKAYHLDGVIALPPDHLEAMAPIEAAVGLRQLRRLDEIQRRRRENAAYYDSALRGVAGIGLPPIVDGATYSHYVVRVADRDHFMNFALRRGVQLGQLIEYCVPDFDAYAPYRGTVPFPEAAALSRQTINLPIHPALERAQVARVADVIRAAASALPSRVREPTSLGLAASS